ncbi:hypothetical protein [Segeticoccus rhizosphaerae]|uniref:hypothetical protein n=1 Tax=Segeticoccus rhizosphaerae TaxID=1104777 RepID=UPI001264151B|nr:hypothetical protein [Segeticoccus rhizosphaerae]
MLDRIKKEPALVVGIIVAVLGVLASFGLGVTDTQAGKIIALAQALLPLLGAGIVRSKVTPAALVAVRDDEGVFHVKRDPATGQFVSTKHVAVDPAGLGKVLGKPEPDGKDTP